jgi:hypothetical protein
MFIAAQQTPDGFLVFWLHIARHSGSTVYCGMAIQKFHYSNTNSKLFGTGPIRR